MAYYQDLKGVALDAYNKMVSTLMKKAGMELSLGKDDLILRSIRPEDIVGTTTACWCFGVTTTSGWNTLINAQVIADNRFVGINGISDGTATPLVSQVRITRAASVAVIWNIQELQTNVDNRAYVDDPFTIDQNTALTIEAWNCTTTTASCYNLVFLGAVVEKRGLLVNP